MNKKMMKITLMLFDKGILLDLDRSFIYSCAMDIPIKLQTITNIIILRLIILLTTISHRKRET